MLRSSVAACIGRLWLGSFSIEVSPKLTSGKAMGVETTHDLGCGCQAESISCHEPIRCARTETPQNNAGLEFGLAAKIVRTPQ